MRSFRPSCFSCRATFDPVPDLPTEPQACRSCGYSPLSYTPLLTDPGIVQRMLKARAEFITAHRRIPNRCTLNADAAAALSDYVQTLEHDPFVGFSPIGKRVMGCTIFEEPGATEEIRYSYEEPSDGPT